MIDIKDGMTFSGKSPFLGFMILSIGVVLLVFAVVEGELLHLLFAFPLIFIGVVIFMKIRGTVIDPKTKQCRVYQDFVLFKLGAWTDIRRHDNITVTFFRERGRPNELGGVAHINTYFVDLLGDGPPIRLKELDDRKKALALGQQVSSALAIRMEDRSALPPPRPDLRR